MSAIENRRIGSSELVVSPLCLGGNVFGWTAGVSESFAVLDAYTAAGGNFIDTADNYTWWADGNVGGESEDIIGRWLTARGNRDQMIVATKVGHAPGRDNLAADTIRAGIDESLRRLRTDYVDLYYAHFPDDDTPLEETLAAFAELVQAGKVRYIAAANHSVSQLRAALDTSARERLPAYVASQTHYNLLHRGEYEGEIAALCAERDLGGIAYFALAQGYLTGKYLAPSGSVDSGRKAYVAEYLETQADSGEADQVVRAAASVAANQAAPIAAVAIAWLLAQPTVTAAIASARTPAQLVDQFAVRQVMIGPTELARLATPT